MAEQKPTLSDVLAALVTAAGRARSSADISSMHLAQLYRSHEFLRGLPVPRLRLNKVVISMPLVVTGIREGTPVERAAPEKIADAVIDEMQRLQRDVFADTAVELEREERRPRLRGPMTFAKKRPSVDEAEDAGEPEETEATGEAPEPKAPGPDQHERLLLERLSNPELHLRDRLITKYQGLSRSFDDQQRNTDVTTDVDVEDAYRRATIDELRAVLVELRNSTDEQIDSYVAAASVQKRESLNEVAQEIRTLVEQLGEVAGRSSIAARTRPPDVEVSVETAEVRNAATPQSITRIHFSLSEEGLEWVAEQGDDGVQWKLMTE